MPIARYNIRLDSKVQILNIWPTQPLQSCKFKRLNTWPTWSHISTKYDHFKNQDQDWIGNPKHTKKLHNALMIKLLSQPRV
jgi:hypothetical protein